MRLAIIYIFLIVSFGLNAQVLTDFNATATVFFVRGTAPDYSIQALINNTTGQYSASDVQVGDVLYMSEGSSCVRFQVLTVTVVGSSISATVRDIDGITSAFPMGIGMICRETANFSFPLHVDGISDDLLSCVRTHFTELVDQIAVTGVPGADTDSIYFDSAGVISLATRGDTVILPIGGGTGVDTDEQNLSRSGDSILIERGTGVDLADLRDNTDTSGYNLDFRVSNDTIFVRDGNGELFAVLPSGVVNADTDSIFVDSAGVKTYLVQRGGTIYVSGDEVDDADADPSNEIQTLTKSNDTIYLSNGGFVIDADTDTNTDTDTLYFQFGSTIIRKVRNDTVNIPVAIDTTFASNDTIFFVSNGDTSIVILDVPGDNWGNQVVISDATLTGNGTVSSPLSVVFPVDQVDDADADPTNEIQLLSKSNDTIYLSNGGGFVIDTDTDTNTDEQNLSLVADSLKIERGSGVELSKYLDNTDTSGYNATLTVANDSIYITDGNGTLKAALPTDLVFDGDSSVTNEIQDITSLAITGGLPDDDVTYELSLTNSDVTVSVIDRVADSDSDPTNEIQDLSIVTDSLLITSGSGVSLLPYKDNTDTSGYNLTFQKVGDSLFITDGSGTLSVYIPDSVGGFVLPTDSITFNNNEAGPDEGELNWDQTIGFPVFGGVGGISIKLGQDALWLCENQTGSPITKGTVVGVVGALGNSGKFLIAPFRADGNTDNDYLLGIAAEDIPSGSDGYVMHQGKIRQIDLTAYPQGAILYASPTVAGALTTIEPANGFQKFPIAFVVDSSANGTLGVRVKTGEALRDLHDVDVSNAADGDLIYYDATAGYWKTKQDSVIDDDADPTNEIQGFTGDDNGTTFTFDLSETANDISLTEGTNVTMTRSGTNVTINAIGDGNGVYDGNGTIPSNTVSLIDGGDWELRATSPSTVTELQIHPPLTGTEDGSKILLFKDNAGASNIGFINENIINNAEIKFDANEDFLLNVSNGNLKMQNNNLTHLQVNQDGTIDLPDYGGGTITGTPTYYLAVDASGNVIESTPSTGTDDQNLTSATLTGTTLQIDIENGDSATVDLAPLQDGNGIFSATNDNTTIADNGNDGKFIATMPYNSASEFIFNGQTNASPTLVIRSSDDVGTRSRLRFESNNNNVITEEYRIESHDNNAYQYFNNLYLRELGTSGNLMTILGQGPSTGAIILDKYKTGFSQTSYNINSTAGILSIGTDGFVKKMQGTSDGQVLTWDSGGFAKFATPTVTTPLTSNEGIEIDNNVIKLGYPTKTSADTNSIGGQGISTKSRFISVADVAAGEYLGFMQSGQSGYNGPYKDSSYIRFLANDYYYSNGESSSNLGFEYWYDTTAAGIVGYDYSTFKLLNKSYIRQVVNWTGVNSVGDYRFEIESEGDIRLNPEDQLQFMNIPNDNTDINLLTIDNNVVSYRTVSSLPDSNNYITGITMDDGNTDNIYDITATRQGLSNITTTVDLSKYLDNTDAQDLSLNNTTLSLSNDDTPVDLSPFLDDTRINILEGSATVTSNATNLKFDASDFNVTNSSGTATVEVNYPSFIITQDSTRNDVEWNLGPSPSAVDVMIKGGDNITIGRTVDYALGQIEITGKNGIYDLTNESQDAAVTNIGVPTFLNFDVNTFYIDGTNNEIGIGTTTPNQKLHVVGTTEIDGRLDLDDGNTSVYIGNLAGINSTASATGNVFVGKSSGTTNTDGYHNTFLGFESGKFNTTGFRNTAVGYQSGQDITTAQENTLLGFQSGRNVTTGNYNTFFGVASGDQITTGTRNNMIGHEAGKELTDAQDNTFLGYRAGHLLNAGNKNVFIGSLAGATDFGEGPVTGLDSASNSIFIGYNTKSATDSITNAIVIGHDSYVGTNETRIGNSATTKTYLEGELYIDNINVAAPIDEMVLASGVPVKKVNVNQIGIPFSTYTPSEAGTVSVNFGNDSKHIAKLTCTGITSSFTMNVSNVFNTANFAAVYNIHFSSVPNNTITVTLDAGKTWYNEVGNQITTITLQANQDKIMTFYTSDNTNFYTME